VKIVMFIHKDAYTKFGYNFKMEGYTKYCDEQVM